MSVSRDMARPATMSREQKAKYDDQVDLDTAATVGGVHSTALLRTDPDGETVLFNGFHKKTSAIIATVKAYGADKIGERNVIVHFGDPEHRIVWAMSPGEARMLATSLLGAADAGEKSSG